MLFAHKQGKSKKTKGKKALSLTIPAFAGTSFLLTIVEVISF